MTISPLAIIYTIALAWFVVIVFQPDYGQCLALYDDEMIAIEAPE